MIRKISDEIFKLEVPFFNIYTAVFFVKTKNGFAIIDTADKSADTENHILPALNELGIEKDSVKAILLTHTHGDHVGGTPLLARECKKAKIYGFARPNVDMDKSEFVPVKDGDIIDESIKAVELKGHDLSNGGFLHLPSKSLFSGDSIQLYGLDAYGLLIRQPKLYLESLKKLSDMEIENIFASHNNVPLGAVAIGKKASKEYLKCAKECIFDMIDFVKANTQEGITEAAELQRLFIEKRQKLYKDFPTANFSIVIEAIKREYM